MEKIRLQKFISDSGLMSRRAAETEIEKGTMIYMFTDGVNEAENNEKEQYSDERLISLLKKHSADTPKVIVDEIFNLRGYASGKK